MTIFIDFGCFTGDTVDLFLSGGMPAQGWRDCKTVQAFDLTAYPAEWDAVKKKYPNVDIAFTRMAVGTSDGITTYEANPHDPQAQTMLSDSLKWNAGVGKATVPRLDVVGWIQRFTQPGNYVVCKMDIEGAEFDILEAMIATGAIKCISELYVEFHSWLLPAEYELREANIRANSPVEIKHWA